MYQYIVVVVLLMRSQTLAVPQLARKKISGGSPEIIKANTILFTD